MSIKSRHSMTRTCRERYKDKFFNFTEKMWIPRSFQKFCNINTSFFFLLTKSYLAMIVNIFFIGRVRIAWDTLCEFFLKIKSFPNQSHIFNSSSSRYSISFELTLVLLVIQSTDNEKSSDVSDDDFVYDFGYICNAACNSHDGTNVTEIAMRRMDETLHRTRFHEIAHYFWIFTWRGCNDSVYKYPLNFHKSSRHPDLRNFRGCERYLPS